MQPSQGKTSKWYLAYFFLAAFDILTVSVSLYLNHQIMKLYTDSVEVNRVWATRLNQLAKLRNLAGEVNAPGNNVFDSHDVASESATMSTKLRQFKKELVAIETDLHLHVSESESKPLFNGLSVVEAAIEDMKDEAFQIFSYFRQNQPDEAGTHMATMDRKYALVHAAFARLSELIRAKQQAQFDHQRATAATMQKFEYVIAFFIIAMVIGATVYGNRIYRQMKADTQEKEQFLKELQEKEERYRLLVEGAKDHANIMLDPFGKVASWNTGAERLHGYPTEETLGQHCAQLFAGGDEKEGKVMRLLQAAESTGTVEEECWNLRKDGSQFWGEVVISALRDESGQLCGFSQVTRNITERKQAREELKKANTRLQEIDQMRTQFFANISHELRTPITILQGEAEVTLRGKDKPIAEYKTTLERIVHLTNQVGKVVNDLLFLARSESGAIQIEKRTIRIYDVLTQASSDGNTLAKKKSLAVTLNGQDPTLIVQGDPQRLRQLFTIIIDNAIHYTNPEGTITITHEREGNFSKVLISDNGIGIPPESLSQVFKRFYRAPQSKTIVQDGTGLGLPIAKWIAQAHQGTISIVSTFGKGTTVTILLPLSPLDGVPNANPAY